jgi:BirA family biotin operon repressor/biotin-[acetyl-CoA-carboxylase] ligase
VQGPQRDDATERDLRLSPFSRVRRVALTGSTNADVAAALRRPGGADEWPHLSVLVADHQTRGRGRAGRTWETLPGSSLTASVVVLPTVPLARWSWLSLLTGLAVARAVTTVSGLVAGLKWPNDVVVPGVGRTDEPGWGRDRKLAGVLVEVVHERQGTPAAVLGLGVNLGQAVEELPVPWATSLAAVGAPPSAREPLRLLDAVGTELRTLVDAWEDAGGDAVRSGAHDAVSGACTTLGRHVRATFPGSGGVTGRATGIAADGSLVVEDAAGVVVHVRAGDVDHLRARSG